MNNKGFLGRELFSERLFPTNYDVLKYKVINEKTRIQIFRQATSMLRKFNFASRDMDSRSFFKLIMDNLKLRRGVTVYTDLMTNTSINIMKKRRSVDINVFSNNKDEGEFFRLLVYTYEQDYLLILDMIDLLSYAVLEHYKKELSEEFDETINEVFRHNGIGYELVKGHLIHKGNEIIHVEITRPAILYLSDPRFSIANEEMLNAFLKFRDSQLQDAIVGANRAFESTMKTIIEINEWSIHQTNPSRKPPNLEHATASVLINTIIENAELENFHKKALQGMKDVLQSVASLRNSHGGHGGVGEQTKTEERHCEFALHMTATNILYLIKTYT